MGWTASEKHGDIMNSKLPLSLKRKVCNRYILRVLTYGSETWRLTKEQERKSRSAQRGITWRAEKRAAWIRDILMTTKKDVVLGWPYNAQNRQQMDKKVKGMATNKLQEKPGQAKNKVERRNSGTRRCRMEYTNIRQSKMEGVRKGLMMMMKCILKTLQCNLPHKP